MFRPALLFSILLLLPGILAAQRRLDCPRPVRERHYRIAPKPYLELAAGMSKPLLYRNAAGQAGENFRFNSRVTPYALLQVFLPLSERVSLFAGASVTQTWQGLRFHYVDKSGSLEVKSYAGTLVVSLPLGVRCRASDRLQLNAGPYISYASHKGQLESGSGKMGSAAFGYRFDAPDHERLNFGLRLAADFMLTKRLGITATLAGDILQSAPIYSRADLGRRAEGVFEGRMEPQLLHAGFGLSYRVGGSAE